MEVAWPGKALTLHVHPHCSQEDMMHLDLAVTAALLAIQGKVSQPEQLQTMAFCGMLGLKGDVVDPLPHRSGTEAVQDGGKDEGMRAQWNAPTFGHGTHSSLQRHLSID